MDLLVFLCLGVVGLIALGAGVVVLVDLVGDALAPVFEVLGWIGAFLIGLVVVGLCCAGLAFVL